MSRSKRFEARVNIERAVLEIVNTSAFSEGTALAGLTSAAIDSWSKRLSLHCDYKAISVVQELLFSIARETGLLADNSRAVFSSTSEHNDQTVAFLVAKLKGQLQGRSHPI